MFHRMGLMIALDHVTKQFDGKRRVVALDDVSLTIEKGEMVSVIGPSGSGKSTLLNLVGALDSPTSGRVLVDGQALDGLADDDLARVRRDKIGFIFQFFNLLPTLSSLENVGLPLHLRGWPRRKVDERARELLALVQLGHRLHHVPEELSGGERQRVAIARALSVYPPVLLADEPTGNLDSHTGSEILLLIRDLHARLGSTVVIVTHDMEVAESCGRTIALRDGRIVEDVRREVSTPSGLTSASPITPSAPSSITPSSITPSSITPSSITRSSITPSPHYPITPLPYYPILR
jgi:putative ABC transport system ATP-binding protein